VFRLSDHLEEDAFPLDDEDDEDQARAYSGPIDLGRNQLSMQGKAIFRSCRLKCRLTGCYVLQAGDR
jgi:hypothetical protein